MGLTEVLVCGSLGLAALVGGAWWGVKHCVILRSSESTRGVIVEWHTEPHRMSTYWFPVVEFRSLDGETVRFRGATGTASNQPGSPATGETVAVLYDPALPSKARINSFVQFWLGPAGLVAMGLSLILVPLYFFLNDRG